MDSRFDPERVTYFATTHTRGEYRAFGIKLIDRLKHMYVIGKTGVGKSTLLENMAIQDIQNGEGLIFIDPHGSTAEKLLDFIPENRIQDVIYFAPFDMENPVAFNIMEDVGFDQRHNVVANLMGVFERLWADSWSARMQYILQNTLLALLEYPDSTIIDVNRMLINKDFRQDVVDHVTDPIVKSFWVEEFANYGDRYTQEATPAIQNKVGQLVSNPLMRNIIGQPKSSFDIRRAMDERKILICNISKGRMGDANSTMLGAVLVIRAYIAALSRAAESAKSMKVLPPCFFYVDEFQNVVNKAFASILSEARKYKLGLIIANQYVAQMEEKDSTTVKDAVFGNVGTTVVFKVGPIDAEALEPLFAPTFEVEDMVGLGVGDIYLTLSIDGLTSTPFSAKTLLPIESPVRTFREEVIEYSRVHYCRRRTDVEQIIAKRMALFPPTPKAPKKAGDRGNFKPAYGNGGGGGGYQGSKPREGSFTGAPRSDAPRQDRPPERPSYRPESSASESRPPASSTPPEVRREERSPERDERPPQDTRPSMQSHESRAPERPREPEPPRTKTPLEIMRAKNMQPNAQGGGERKQSEAPTQREDKNRNSLKDALAALSVPQPKETKPAPASAHSPKPQGHPNAVKPPPRHKPEQANPAAPTSSSASQSPPAAASPIAGSDAAPRQPVSQPKSEPVESRQSDNDEVSSELLKRILNGEN
jgi:energy-coupling factor transporter ATP-binding protein EcfA2